MHTCLLLPHMRQALCRWRSALLTAHMPAHLQILISTVCVLTLVMCFAKSFIDSNVAPWSGEGAGQKKKKKVSAPAGTGEWSGRAGGGLMP